MERRGVRPDVVTFAALMAAAAEAGHWQEAVAVRPRPNEGSRSDSTAHLHGEGSWLSCRVSHGVSQCHPNHTGVR